MSVHPGSLAPRFRRPRLFTTDLLIKAGSLIFAIIAVWFFYRIYVYPNAEQTAIEGRIMARDSAEGFVAARTVAVVMKDNEQRWELTFWVWSVILLSLKLRRISQENHMLGMDYLQLEPGERILPEDSLTRLKDLDGALAERPGWRERILPNVILTALHRFHATRSIMDASQAVKERAEVSANDFEADLSLVRYIAWAIPAIGFIGTVRGIGEALAQAGKAIAGDITGVVDALGLAFNSTLVALLLSMPLMFLLHLVQGRQDKLFVDLIGFCDDHLVGQMKVPADAASSPAFQA